MGGDLRAAGRIASGAGAGGSAHGAGLVCGRDVLATAGLEIGALCHPMLPNHPDGRREELSVAAARRYVDFAIRDLAAQFDALGAHAARDRGQSCSAAPTCCR